MKFCFKTTTIFLLLCMISNSYLPVAAMSLLDSHGDALTHNDEVIRVDDIPLNGCTFDQINITTGYLIVSQRKPTELENLFIGAHDQASAAKASVPGAIKLATA